MDEQLVNRIKIREVVENWAIYRDAGDWDRFSTVWHTDGWMTATWFQGSAREFIQASRKGFDAGVSILHFLGGTSSDVAGGRAIAQTKMTISQRATVHDVWVDVTCTGRFYDFFEQERGEWKVVRRQPIYEKDRLDVLNPAAALVLDQAKLERFPVGYRHLAYLQQEVGYEIREGLPGLTGPEIELLYKEGQDWLAGSTSPGSPL